MAEWRINLTAMILAQVLNWVLVSRGENSNGSKDRTDDEDRADGKAKDTARRCMSQSLSVIFKTLPRHFPSRFQPRLSSSFQSRVYTWEGNRIRFSYRYRVHFLAQHMWNRCILWQPLFVFKSFVCQLKREEGHWGRLDSRTFHIQFSEVFNFLAFQAEALPSPRSYANGANLGGVFHLTGFNVNISCWILPNSRTYDVRQHS